MGEVWMGMWLSMCLLIGIGLFVIAVAIYDYRDRKKRNQEIKRWKYGLAILIGSVMVSPVVVMAGAWLWRVLR